MKINILYSLILLFWITSANTQELNCQVSVTSDPALDVTTVEKEVFSQLEQTIFELVNTTAWTKDEFEVEERINCNMVISVIKVNSPGNYEATLQVQVSRPVFNTSYNTTLFNFLDENVQFSFERNAILVYSPNQFRNNLTSIIAFYAYMILGYDYDSFALNGGDEHFRKAQEIVMLAQSGGGSGWRSNERGRKNRYWLVDNALQELFSPLRECFYEYHRKGLDKMYDNPEEARNNMFAAIEKLSKVNTARPGSVNVLNFLQAKVKEMKGIFSDAPTKQKTDLVNILKRLDPSNSSKYQEIL